jgi:protocatechuate 3,4-dioxygenase beta subunit
VRGLCREPVTTAAWRSGALALARTQIVRRAWQTPASAIVRRVDSSRFTRFHENAGPDDGDAFTAPVAAGPYYIPDAPYRSDVREDREGKPLVLELGVISAESRQPLDGVTAELWQCDALGRYSGYLANDAGQFPDFLRLALEQFRPSDGTRFLRGKQNADSDGQVRFQTIVPGWYTPRTPHIHLKLSLSSRALLTTQLFFPDELAVSVGTGTPYDRRRPALYTNRNDAELFRSKGARGCWPVYESSADGYRGRLTIAVPSPSRPR